MNGRPVVAGEAEGEILRARSPISLWGGVDPNTGSIIDRRHDRCGESIVGRVFVFPSEKGSSTGSAVLLELIRNGRPPAAVITHEPAPIVALGSIVADELYGRSVPVLVVADADAAGLVDGLRVRIAPDGTIEYIDPVDGSAAGLGTDPSAV